MDINHPWVLMGAGFIFCAGGVYLFHRHAFEENKGVLRPALIILAGVTLIGIAMAKLYHVIS